MKIVHVIIGLKVGGAEKALQRLVTRLNGRHGQIHEVIALTPGGVIASELENSGVKVVVIPADSFFSIILLIPRLVSYFKKNSPDVVQTWMYHADLFGGVAAKLAGIEKILWGIRTTNPQFGASKLTLALRWVCSRLSYYIPNKIVCVAFAARDAHILLGYDESKMLVIHNGIEVPHLTENEEVILKLRMALGIPKEGLVVGSIGRFNRAKNHSGFIEAMNNLMGSHAALYAVMIGRDIDNENPEIGALLSGSGFSERFILLGERDDVPDLIKIMNVFCMHSLTEGFPNVVSEAMALGRPCVVTDVGDAAYIVDNTGLVVPPNDICALSEAIEHMILAAPEERRANGRDAYLRAANCFSVDRMEKSFSDLYGVY